MFDIIHQLSFSIFSFKKDGWSVDPKTLCQLLLERLTLFFNPEIYARGIIATEDWTCPHVNPVNPAMAPCTADEARCPHIIWSEGIAGTVLII